MNRCLGCGAMAQCWDSLFKQTWCLGDCLTDTTTTYWRMDMANKKSSKRADLAKRAAKKDAARVAATAPAPRSKKAMRKLERERIADLMRDGLKRGEAKRIVQHHNPESDELQVGMLVQYYHMGFRYGFVADLPGDGRIKIQPIGPKGAEQPATLYVRSTDVKIPETGTGEHNTMASIKAKAAELTTNEENKKAAKAAQLADSLKKAQAAKKAKAQPAAATEAAPTKTSKAPKANKLAKEESAQADKREKKAAKKSAGEKRSHSSNEQTWKFVKVGPATGQRALILEVLQSLGGSASRDKLAAAFAKKVDSSQDANTVLSLKKKFLVDNGCVKIS